MRHLEPNTSTWSAGWLMGEGELRIGLCSDPHQHACELRDDLTEPYRLRFFAATVPLAALENASDRLFDLAPQPAYAKHLNGWSVDIAENAIRVATSDSDGARLAGRLQSELGVRVQVFEGSRATLV